ncbi:MAG: DUF2232 domain-containing protein [Gemmatimonadota bacterium]
MAFLLLPVPPLMVAGPLAGLLLLARPGSWRERWWLAAALSIAVLSFALGDRNPAGDLVRAAGLIFSGSLVALAAWRRGGAFGQSAAAAGFTALAASGLGWMNGLDWGGFRVALETQLRTATSLILDGSTLPAAQREGFEASIGYLARLYPGIAVVCMVVGGVLALAVAHRIARHPVGPLPGRFSDFRFNDHLIWGAVATFAGALMGVSGAPADLIANLLVLWVGLYGFRGAAVAVTALRQWNPWLRAALFLSAVLLLPYAMGAALLLGLADTWLDFRRALTPPHTGGSTT